jgi:DNA invertase Pin-like site-specific DNA recombinase
MCGIGTTLVEAIHTGRHAVGVELEGRWAKLAAANVEHAREQGATGQAQVIKGDARRLPALLSTRAQQLLRSEPDAHARLAYETVDLVLTSPPYACQVADLATENAQSGRGPLRREDTTNYSPDRRNLGHARGDAYLAAMADVYQACAAILKPGGFLVRPARSSSRSRNGSPTGGCTADASSPTPPVPVKTPAELRTRAVAYVRESTEEQGQGFSPDAQRQAVAKFAEENNFDLIAEYCDFHSGWRKSEARPEFQRLMADAAAGQFDVVLVFHTSRFARSQVEARRYKQLLRERLGIRVVSVTQPMGEDHTDPSAFLAESIHEMFDEYYSVSLSFWIRSGLREKARQGHLLGTLPWGYVRDPQSKLAVPHPERAPLVLGMFERYATGHESDRTIAAWLNAKGTLGAKGRPFGKETVRDMLCNASYADT